MEVPDREVSLVEVVEFLRSREVQKVMGFGGDRMARLLVEHFEDGAWFDSDVVSAAGGGPST